MLASRSPLLMLLLLVGCKVAAGRESEGHSTPLPGRSALPQASTPRTPAASAAIPPEESRPPSPSRPCPPDMVQVRDYCIDRYEAHLATRAKDGSFVKHPAHTRPSATERYYARSEEGERPQAYISRVEAAAACESSEKRLCGVEEWFQACRGSGLTTYPYGRKFERGRCNVGKPHLLSRFFGTDARQWEYKAHFNNPMLSQQPGFLASTGEYRDCVSDYGVFDMVGNVQEWVADRPDQTLLRKLPLKEGIRRSLGSGAGKGIFMGGFYSTTHEHGRGCAFVTAAHEVRYHDYSTGFRCCRDALNH